MDCTQLRRDLQLVWDGELDAAQAALAARHLATCPECRDLIERGRAFDALVRARAGATTAAPAGLRAAVQAFVAAPAPAPRSRLVRALGSPWAPRLAMAAVLALVLLGPLLWRPQRAGALALGAAEQHACHAAAPGDGLPACCTAEAVTVGGRLGEPSPGVVVPDLAPAGLAWQLTTRCTFAPTPVHMLVYTDAAGGRFSLYTTAHGAREFDFVRPQSGAQQVHRSIALKADAHHAAVDLEVTMWERAGIVYTWVGPAGTAYRAGLGMLQPTP